MLTTLCDDYYVEEKDKEFNKVLEKLNIAPIVTEEVCGICLSEEADIQIKTICGYIFYAPCILLHKYEQKVIHARIARRN